MNQFSVLVVDDEEDFVSLLVRRLQRKGIDCEGALTGWEAIDRLKARDFDVVLLDMQLGDGNGNDVLRKIKAIRNETQVVILSGHPSVSAGREGLGSGAFDYLIKPVEFESLFEKLAEARKRQIAS